MFKLVCGAGNEDCESVKRLVYIYAKAGWRFFDLSARKEILESAKEALKLANVDDAIGVLVLAKFPIADKLHIDKMLPIVYSYCGYRAGKSN